MNHAGFLNLGATHDSESKTKGRIMADSAEGGSALAQALAQYWRQTRRKIATPCPLCAGRAAAGLLCAGCESDIKHTAARCRRCALRLPAMDVQCPDCLRRLPAFAQTVAAFDYEPPVDSLIHLFKTELKFAYADLLAGLLQDAMCCATVSLENVDVLTAIPSSRTSLRRRGFNPAAEIARALAGVTAALPLRHDVLQRRREGPRQAAGNRRTRLDSAHGLFECRLALHGKTVAIVDDVMTTGSTMDAAAQAVLDAGALSVTALVVARTP